MAHIASQPDRLVRWMTSLADGTRLRLLALLDQEELAVSDLCEIVQMPQSTVSRHLKILADEGWVVNRRQGTTNLYAMPVDGPGGHFAPGQQELWGLAREQSSQWATLDQDRIRLEQLIRTRDQDATTFFADAAAQWDQIRHELYGSAFTGHAVAGLLPGDWTVADLGCGSGSLACELSPFVEQIIGVDSSAAMLKAARKNIRELKNIDLRRGDLTDVPLDDASCDAALCVLVLTYVADVQQAICEMARIVRPGGRVVVLDLLVHDRDAFRRQMGQVHMGFKIAMMEKMLQDAGLSQICCRPLPPAPQATGPALLLATASKPAA